MSISIHLRLAIDKLELEFEVCDDGYNKVCCYTVFFTYSVVTLLYSFSISLHTIHEFPRGHKGFSL